MQAEKQEFLWAAKEQWICVTAGNISDVVLVKKKNHTWCVCSELEVLSFPLKSV